jgi:nicotinate-nucleotide adenylyltransferase
MARSANSRARRIGVLGGTFDPVHNGHLALAQAALRQLKLDTVYFLLSPRSPFKLRQKITPAPLRLAMLRRALVGRRGFRVATWELNRRGPSYMVTTLSRRKKSHPREEIFLILGSDAFAGFERWKNPRKILDLATVVVGRRPGANLPKRIPGATVLNGTFPLISSTDLRAEFALAKPGKTLLPAAVRSFIFRRKLYSPPHVLRTVRKTQIQA